MLHKSSSLHYYTLKYTAIIASMFLLIFTKGLSIENFSMPVLIMLFFCLFLGILFYKKTNYAAINYKQIELNNGQEIIRKQWSEVVSIKFFPMLNPPIYIVTFKGHSQTYWFVTQAYWSIWPFALKDMSPMGKLIRNKRLELDL